MPPGPSPFRYRRKAPAKTYWKKKYTRRRPNLMTPFNQSLFQTPVKSPEFKYADTGGQQYLLDTTGTVTLVNPVAGGDTEQMRTGQYINITSVQVRGEVQIGSATTIAGVGRVLIVYDKMSQVGAPTFTDLLTNSDPAAFVSRLRSSRYIILMDYYVPYGIISPGNLQSLGKNLVYEKTIKCSLPVQYTSVTSTAIESGSIYAMTLGTVSPGATAATFFMAVRIRFCDA